MPRFVLSSMTVADKNLYKAKNTGRNRAVMEGQLKMAAR